MQGDISFGSAKRFREACNYLSHLVPRVENNIHRNTIPNGAKKAPIKGRSSKISMQMSLLEEEILDE